MEVLNGLFRSKRLFVFEDGYGGSPSWKYMYSYILFKGKACYLFYSLEGLEIVGQFNHEKLKPITSFDDKKTIKNIEIILSNASKSNYENIDKNIIKFNLPIQIADEHGGIIEINRTYNAIIEKDYTFLKLKAWNENSSDEIVIDEEFEQINPRSA